MSDNPEREPNTATPPTGVPPTADTQAAHADSASAQRTKPVPATAPGEQAADEPGTPAPPPPPDPDSCRGVAICQAAFERAVSDGELDNTDYLFYIEPAGVLNARLQCTRCPSDDGHAAGILMTRDALVARTVFFDDGVNPERYDLLVPKEIGYVKSIQHYRSDSREHAKYPWSKRY